MTAEQKSSEYYRFAYQCEEFKAARRCNAQCNSCPLNVHLYLADPAEATLIKTSAAMDFYNIRNRTVTVKRQLAAAQIGRAIAAVLIIGTLWVCTAWCVRGCKSFMTVAQPQDVYDWTPSAQSDAELDSSRVIRNILNAFYYTRDYVYDVNNDAKYDCIDYTLVFYEYIQRISGMPMTRIMWNYNPDTGMNHIFIAIYMGHISDISWWCLEPQWCKRMNTDPSTSITMDAYWGDKYNAIYDTDVTTDIVAIKNRTFKWVR